ncbi:hypothetical protein A5733_21465 [Mycobacterium sp. NS-7484]|nr:hypothetical protein A5733_21465 [Mycobacterium sp. NS-7484]
MPATVVAVDAPVEHPLVTLGQRAITPDQQIQLLPAQSVEFTIGVVGGDDDAAAQQRYGLGAESGCGQQEFSGTSVGETLAPVA